MSLVTKTGNMEDVIKIIRTRLSIVGLGYNLVPCIRLVKKSTSEIQSYFTAMCEPERTFSGFRCNLIKCVETVSYFLLGTKELNGLRVDIWGDGCEIGGVETTRIVFPILTDKIKCQSSNSVICFAAYRGKDSRFAIEQNLGSNYSWSSRVQLAFYEDPGTIKTKSYFDIQWRLLFLMRLVLGTTNESASPSKMLLYLTDPNYTLTQCHHETGLRSDVIIPLRTDLPKSSLVFYKNIQSVCPDATHMTTRCVENDLQRNAQKIIREKYLNHDVAIRQLEENLTRKDAKRPYFQFNVSHRRGSCIGTVGAVSLAGNSAQAIIADKEELAGARDGKISDLYDGVWGPEDISVDSEESADVLCVTILRNWFPKLFNKDNPMQKGSSDHFISAFDACELLRSSLNQCVLCLRAEEFNGETFKKWAEAYYQTNILIFGHAGLTPYKMKMLMFPQLVKSRYIQRPFDHLCEGLEKSNHQANRGFQTKTMRGGGEVYHKDPLFLESSFSFLKFLRFAVETEDKGLDAESTSKNIMEPEQNATTDVYFDDHNVTRNKKNDQTVSKSTSNSVMSILHSATKVMDIHVPGPEYFDICRKEPPLTAIAIGCQENPLSGLRVCLLGRLGTWKKHTLTHDMVKHLIIKMGGTVLGK